MIILAAKKKNYVEGAAILAVTLVIVKILGFLFKIPLANILDDRALADFNVSYNVYALLLTISTSGVPVAISRLISESNSLGRVNQAKRVFSVSMPAFCIIGAVCALVTIVFSRQIADFMLTEGAGPSIALLGLAVFFCCVVSVYRGYSQGHEDMVPTSVSQVVEVVFKLVFGLGLSIVFVKFGMNSDMVAAGAIAGAVIGVGINIPLLAWFKKRAEKKNSYNLVETDKSVMSRKDTLKEIFRITIPMTLSSSLLSIITLIDTKVVRSQLANSLGLSPAAVDAEYGVFSKAHYIFNLPSSLIVSISVSIVPAIAAAVAIKKYHDSAEVMSTGLKIMNLFALPMGVGMCVLANPIYNVFYWDGRANGPLVLSIMGIASYFVCFQLVSTALVQASGFEKIALFSMPAGSLIKMFINWKLVGMPQFGILGAPISTLVCYLLISLFNMIGLMRKVPEKPKLGPAFIKPLICSGVMGACAWGVYGLLTKIGGGYLISGRLPMAIALCISIVIAVIVYGVMVIFTGTLTRADMQLVPKGDKIANILKLK